MSDALPLPARPNLEQYRKLAKDLQHACQSGGPDAVQAWAWQWVETLARLQYGEITPETQPSIAAGTDGVARHWRKLRPPCTLVGAQFFIARCHGFASWPKFLEHLRGM